MTQLYYGQSVVLVDEPEVPKPAIYLGKEANGNVVIVYEHPAGVAGKPAGTPVPHQLTDGVKDLRFVKQADKNSITGRSIWFGNLHRKAMGDQKMKCPEEKLLRKEFSEIRKLM